MHLQRESAWPPYLRPPAHSGTPKISIQEAGHAEPRPCPEGMGESGRPGQRGYGQPAKSITLLPTQTADCTSTYWTYVYVETYMCMCNRQAGWGVCPSSAGPLLSCPSLATAGVPYYACVDDGLAAPRILLRQNATGHKEQSLSMTEKAETCRNGGCRLGLAFMERTQYSTVLRVTV